MEINKIYHGDAINLIEDLDIEPKLIIMSPPDLENNFNINSYKQFLDCIYSKCMCMLDKNGVLFSCTTDRKIDRKIYTKHIDIINTLNEYDLFNYKIWCKSFKTNLFILNYTHMLFFRKRKKITNNKLKDFYPDVWNISLDKVKGYKNKDSFPSELVRRVVLNFTNEKDLVLDPFIGTGKTAVVCKELNRNYIGFELEQSNIDIANNLLNSLSSSTPNK